MQVEDEQTEDEEEEGNDAVGGKHNHKVRSKTDDQSILVYTCCTGSCI